MSPRFNPKTTTAERAQAAMGVQVPLRRTNRFRANALRGGRGLEQLQQRWWRLTRVQRPILGFLVTHRRRFTTGHKHKQPYRG